MAGSEDEGSHVASCVEAAVEGDVLDEYRVFDEPSERSCGVVCEKLGQLRGATLANGETHEEHGCTPQ